VALDSSVQGQLLTVELHGAPGAAAQFRVQLWTLLDTRDGSQRERVGEPAMREDVATDGHLTYTIPTIDKAAYNRLGLVITRIDAHEGTDATGASTLVLRGEAGN
jgi:hypothetical protein